MRICENGLLRFPVSQCIFDTKLGHIRNGGCTKGMNCRDMIRVWTIVYFMTCFNFQSSLDVLFIYINLHRLTRKIVSLGHILKISISYKNIFSSTRSHHFKYNLMFAAIVVFLDQNILIKSLFRNHNVIK